jgi:hypothetical protein
MLLGLGCVDVVMSRLEVFFQWHLVYHEMHPHNYIRYLMFYRMRRFPIETSDSGKMLLCKEWDDWERDYLPRNGVKGKTVLDVGAGCGETAWFYFQHGAKKVIAVEPDPKKLVKLRRNAAKMRWDMDIYPERFMLKHIALQYDFVKLDCEGGEALLLQLSWLPPLSMEIHYEWLAERFHVQFPQMKIKRQYPIFPTWMGKVD